MTAVEVAGTTAKPPVPNDKALDEDFFVSVLDKLEGWLANNQPGTQLRLALLRTSQTTFAAAAEEAN